MSEKLSPEWLAEIAARVEEPTVESVMSDQKRAMIRRIGKTDLFVKLIFARLYTRCGHVSPRATVILTEPELDTVIDALGFPSRAQLVEEITWGLASET